MSLPAEASSAESTQRGFGKGGRAKKAALVLFSLLPLVPGPVAHAESAPTGKGIILLSVGCRAGAVAVQLGTSSATESDPVLLLACIGPQGEPRLRRGPCPDDPNGQAWFSLHVASEAFSLDAAGQPQPPKQFSTSAGSLALRFGSYADLTIEMNRC